MNKTERCVGYYLDEKDANPAFRPDSASLEDGSVLKALLDKFDGRRDDKALYAVMRCLRDSFLYVKKALKSVSLYIIHYFKASALRQYRIIIAVRLRSQIFRQIV